MTEKNNKPRVAILTSLVDYSPAYSLTGIILDQCRMLRDGGYSYDLLCLKAFNRKEWGAAEIEAELSVRYILPQTVLKDYKPEEPPDEPGTRADGKPTLGFEQQADAHFEGTQGTVGYREALKDYDVIISHDLMFLTWHLPQNAALRRCISMWPEKTWIHWVHSGPSPRPINTCYPSTLRFEKAPDSTYVYLNHRQRHDYALMIGASDKDIAVVYNPKDIRDVWGFSDLAKSLIKRYDLLDHEILQVYPFSTPRWRDKGIPQLLAIFGNWRKTGVSAKLVLVNAHANSDRDLPEIEAIEKLVEQNGLRLDVDVILTSRYADEIEPEVDFKKRRLRYTVPFQAVRELVMASNLFIFPSVSECCSLIQAEASMSGKFMVLNRDFAPMLEFCDKGVMHFEFTRNPPDRNPEYYVCVAREVLVNLRAEASIVNRTEAITRTYNRDWIFRNQFEPLLWQKASQRVRRPQPAKREVVFAEKPKPRPVEVKKQPVLLESPEGVIPVLVDETEGIEVEVDIDPGALMSINGPKIHGQEDEGDGAKLLKISDWNNPREGQPCPIYGSCTTDRKASCYKTSGHCQMLDEEPQEFPEDLEPE